MIVHRIVGSPDLLPVNAYLVEAPDAVIAVDGTLTRTGGRAVRARVRALGKPLAAVLVTHPHPDHYGGVADLVGGDDVPVWAHPDVWEALEAIDGPKDEELVALLGEDWPDVRRLPDHALGDGEALEIAGVRFEVLGLGPGESTQDSVWFAGADGRAAFVGDVVYSRTHAYLAEATVDLWLAQLERLEAELSDHTVLYPGHGAAGGSELLAWQRGYLQAAVAATQRQDWSHPNRATEAVLEDLAPLVTTEALRILIEPSLPLLAAALGLVSTHSNQEA